MEKNKIFGFFLQKFVNIFLTLCKKNRKSIAKFGEKMWKNVGIILLKKCKSIERKEILRKKLFFFNYDK